MADLKDNEKERPKSFVEIEKKLKEALAKKEEEIEMNIKRKREQEEEESESKPEQAAIGHGGERKALLDLGNMVNEFKINIENLKNKIKENLIKITQFQKEIETLTGQTVKELESMNEPSQKLEEFSQEVTNKIFSIKNELEEEFKALEKAPEKENYEEGVDFGEELARVKKLKDILGKQEAGKTEEEMSEKARLAGFPVPGAAEETVVAGEDEYSFEVEENSEKMKTQLAEMEKAIKEKPLPTEPQEKVLKERKKTETVLSEKEKLEERPVPEAGKKEEFKIDETLETMFSGRWKKHWQDAIEKKETKVQPGVEAPPQRRRASDFYEILEKYQKAEPPEEDAELLYYQNNEKIVLDSESIISSLSRHLAEGKKLYTKLPQTRSPKEQFFVKQEIIRHQEALRDVFLRSVKLLEKESCTLPMFTMDIVNIDFLKEILEKLSIGNWSDLDDFAFFEESIEKVRSDFNQRMTPKVNYLKSLVDELQV